MYLNDLWLLDVSVSADPSQWSWRTLLFEGLAPSPRDMASLVDISGLTERPYSLLLFGGYGLTEIDEDLEDEEERADGEVEVSGKGKSSEIDQADDTSTKPLGAEMIGLHDSPVSGSEEQSHPQESVAIIPLLQSSLTISGPNETFPHIPPSVGGDLQVDPGIGVSEEQNQPHGDDSEAEEGSVCESYLNDAWLIDILTGEAREVELMSLEESKQSFFLSGWRGSRFAVLQSSDPEVTLGLCCFGGFNGQQFGEYVPSISIQ